MTAHKNFIALLLLFLLTCLGVVSFLFFSNEEILIEENPLAAEEKEMLINQDETIDNLVGSLFMIGHWADTPVASTTALIEEYHFGGVIIMSSPGNPDDIKKWVTEWNSASDHPLLIAIDQEGGPVTRLRSSDFVQTGQRDINTEEQAYAVGLARGKELAELGINMNFAPVLDIAKNPDSFMYSRVFPFEGSVSQFASELTRGHRDSEVIAVGKHFPGHDDTSDDSHFTLPSVSISKSELPIFTENFSRYLTIAKPKALMTAHVLFPEIDTVPATLSKFFLTDYLRGSLGFTGVIITDDMSMKAIDTTWSSEEAAAMSLAAGADMILFAAEPARATAAVSVVQSAITSGRLDILEIEKSSDRIRSLLE